jgi:hypothetical protein
MPRALIRVGPAAFAARFSEVQTGARGTVTADTVDPADVDRGLRIRLRTVEADFRITMALGLALLVVGLGMHRPLCNRLLALSRPD